MIFIVNHLMTVFNRLLTFVMFHRYINELPWNLHEKLGSMLLTDLNTG